jgi:hypothetical protein
MLRLVFSKSIPQVVKSYFVGCMLAHTTMPRRAVAFDFASRESMNGPRMKGLAGLPVGNAVKEFPPGSEERFLGREV